MKNLFIACIIFLLGSCSLSREVQVFSEEVQLVAIVTHYRQNADNTGWINYYELQWQTKANLTYTEYSYERRAIGERKTVLLTK